MKTAAPRGYLPAEFYPFWRRLVEMHKGNAARARRHLRKMWTAGLPIPGLGKGSPYRPMPKGTSLTALHRKLDRYTNAKS